MIYEHLFLYSHGCAKKYPEASLRPLEFRVTRFIIEEEGGAASFPEFRLPLYFPNRFVEEGPRALKREPG